MNFPKSITGKTDNCDLRFSIKSTAIFNVASDATETGFAVIIFCIGIAVSEKNITVLRLFQILFKIGFYL